VVLSETLACSPACSAAERSVQVFCTVPKGVTSSPRAAFRLRHCAPSLPSSQHPTVCFAWHCRRTLSKVGFPLARTTPSLDIPLSLAAEACHFGYPTLGSHLFTKCLLHCSTILYCLIAVLAPGSQLSTPIHLPSACFIAALSCTA